MSELKAGIAQPGWDSQGVGPQGSSGPSCSTYWHEVVPSPHGASCMTEFNPLYKQGLKSRTEAWGSLPHHHHLDARQRSLRETLQ